MRHLLIVATASIGVSLSASAFAGSFEHGAGGCGFSAAHLQSVMKHEPTTAPPVRQTAADVERVLKLPQVASLLDDAKASVVVPPKR